jgi:hypothetical protein
MNSEKSLMPQMSAPVARRLLDASSDPMSEQGAGITASRSQANIQCTERCWANHMRDLGSANQRKYRACTEACFWSSPP